jgi:enediyne biosynthesis protein E4
LRLLVNQGTSGNHWITLQVEQERANRFAFGAWVGVERSGQPTIWRRVRTDGSYLSASDTRVHVGLGSSPAIAGVIVQWPDGQRERWNGITADKLVKLKRGTGRP